MWFKSARAVSRAPQHLLIEMRGGEFQRFKNSLAGYYYGPCDLLYPPELIPLKAGLPIAAPQTIEPGTTVGSLFKPTVKADTSHLSTEDLLKYLITTIPAKPTKVDHCTNKVRWDPPSK